MGQIPEKETIEKSWTEQRAYVYRAAEQLGVDLTDTLNVPMPDTAMMTPIDALNLLYKLQEQAKNK